MSITTNAVDLAGSVPSMSASARIKILLVIAVLLSLTASVAMGYYFRCKLPSVPASCSGSSKPMRADEFNIIWFILGALGFLFAFFGAYKIVLFLLRFSNSQDIDRELGVGNENFLLKLDKLTKRTVKNTPFVVVILTLVLSGSLFYTFFDPVLATFLVALVTAVLGGTTYFLKT